MIIFDRFWDTDPENLKEGTEPIMEFVSGIPSVRVFHEIKGTSRSLGSRLVL